MEIGISFPVQVWKDAADLFKKGEERRRDGERILLSKGHHLVLCKTPPQSWQVTTKPIGGLIPSRTAARGQSGYGTELKGTLTI